ncbi:uncharacterized protein LOC110982141 [Acanthaster planci]|uniref:Uncharacterized protein LOC110982141 n=1 Tax=Acanthaster planci TaxID=133434 RepID=A0A8B7YXQ0_ACAPL|nr:uncharacterized protein LOC110982141 [Acanthaster planci]
MGCAVSSGSTLDVSSSEESFSNLSLFTSKKAVSIRETLPGQLSDSDLTETLDVKQPIGDKLRHARGSAIEIVSLTSFACSPGRVLLPLRNQQRQKSAAGAIRKKTKSDEITGVLSPSKPLATVSHSALNREIDQTASRRAHQTGLRPDRKFSSLPIIHKRARCRIKFLAPLRFRKVRSDDPICRAFFPIELPQSRHQLVTAVKQTSEDIMSECGNPNAKKKELRMSDFGLEQNDFSLSDCERSEDTFTSDSIGPTRILPRPYARVLSSDSSLGNECDQNATYDSEDISADESPPCDEFSTPAVLSLLDHIDGSNSSEDMSDISSTYPVSSDSDSSRSINDVSDEGFSDTSCTLGAVDLSGLHIMPKIFNPSNKHPASAPILYQANNVGSDSAVKHDRGLGDNLQNSASRPVSAIMARGTTLGKSASFQTTRRLTTKRTHPSIRSMVLGDHSQGCDKVMSPAFSYANIHLHVNFFNDFGDNFDDEQDFL